MDIDLLWATGGWFLIPDCMATFRTSTSALSSHENSTKSHHPFLLFLSFLFIFLVLVHSSDPSTDSSTPTRRLLADQTTVNLHPKKTPNPKAASSASNTRREFGAKAHEVPSGPNPISNRSGNGVVSDLYIVKINEGTPIVLPKK